MCSRVEFVEHTDFRIELLNPVYAYSVFSKKAFCLDNSLRSSTRLALVSSELSIRILMEHSSLNSIMGLT
jgi:hypothetical protein